MRLYAEIDPRSSPDGPRIFQSSQASRTHPNYRYDHEWIGRRIWRPVRVTPGGQRMIQSSNGFLFRNETTHAGYSKKVFRAYRRADGELIATDDNSKGRICNCYVPIPDDWTYFVIEAVHIREISVMVRPMVGKRKELLQKY